MSDQRSTLRLLSNALTHFQSVSSTAPVAAMNMFITVALNEGLSLQDLTELTGLPKSTASRYLLDLSEKTRKGEDGFRLVKREADPTNLRSNMYSLTPKGRALIKSLVGEQSV